MRALGVWALLLALLAGVHQLPHGRTVDSYGPGRQLPHCATEDGSYGPVPCRWDGARDGNGMGDSYWIDSALQVHYVWLNPANR